MWRQDRDQINLLISKKKYKKAIRLLKAELAHDPKSVFLRQQLAHVLTKADGNEEALQILNRLVNEFANEGFFAKAIAVIKKMERIQPGWESLEKRLAQLIEKQESSKSPDGRPELIMGHLSHESASIPLSTAEEENKLKLEESALPGHEKGAGFDKSPLFSGFTSEELYALIRGLNLQHYESGEIVVTEGESGSSLYVLSSGSLRVYAKDHAGHNSQVRLLEEGSFFGEISLLSHQPRTATVVAASIVELLELDAENLADITKNHPDVPEILKGFYKNRLNSAEEQEARRQA